MLRNLCQQGRFSTAATPGTPVVNSHTEWDTLEEVIVGRVDNATLPEWHVAGKAVWPSKWWDMYKTQGGTFFPQEMREKGNFHHVVCVHC